MQNYTSADLTALATRIKEDAQQVNEIAEQLDIPALKNELSHATTVIQNLNSAAATLNAK